MLPDTGTVGTRDQYEAEIDFLRNQLMYHHALLAILVELEGGVVKVTKEVLDNYDLTTDLSMELDAESLVWTISIVHPGEVVSDVTA